MSNPTCPFRIIQNSSQPVFCWDTDCALWDHLYERCSLKSAGVALVSAAHNLEKIVKALDK